MKNILFIILALLILTSCNKTEDKTVAKNFLRVNETMFPQTFSTKKINDAVSSRIIMQVFEGLVKYDVKRMTIIPAIAKTWSVDASETVYTFNLRDDAYFHDNKCFKDGKGRQIIADDFIFTFENICTKSDGIENFFGLYENIVGATDFYDVSEKLTPDFPLQGVKAIDDFTLEITLVKPFYLFLNILANPISSVIPKEGIAMYGKDNFVGSGAFYLSKKPIENKNIVLHKNTNYNRADFIGRPIPFLDSIIISFTPHTTTQISLLENDKLDIILNLNKDEVNEFLGIHKADFESNPPKYIMEHENTEKFNIRRSFVQNFLINEMGYADYSLVQIKALTPLMGDK